MKYNLNVPIVDFSGRVMKDVGPDSEIIDSSLSRSIINALFTPVANEQGIQKLKKYELAKKIFSCKDEIDLTNEEIILIKSAVGANLPPLVVGTIEDLFKG